MAASIVLIAAFRLASDPTGRQPIYRRFCRGSRIERLLALLPAVNELRKKLDHRRGGILPPGTAAGSRSHD
jgi:hypothetical protein